MADAAMPKQNLPLTGTIVFLVTVWGLAGAVVWRGGLPNDALMRLSFIVFFILQVPVLVLFHEFGHYGMARFVGWRVPVFVWGSLIIRLTPFRVTKGPSPFGTAVAGAVVVVPPQGKENRRNWIAIFAAGPLASLCCGIASLLLSIYAGRNFDAGIAFTIFAVLCFADTALNLLPVSRRNDGRNILNLLRGSDIKRDALFVRLSEQEFNGVRPRDWPADLVAAMRLESVWSDFPDASVNVYIHHLDRGEFDIARKALDRAAENTQVLVERAFLAAFVDNDAAAARAQLAKAPPNVLQSYGRYWQAAAAVAVAEKDRPAAFEAIRKARIRNTESPYATDLDCEVLDTLERRLGGMV